MRTQVIDRSVHNVSRFEGVDEFEQLQHVPQGILSIVENGIPIDVMNSNKGSDVTIVFFHGAIEPTHKLPVLSGQGISGGIATNRVFISDPSLYMSEDLWLGWYAGNAKQDLQPAIVRILTKIFASHASTRFVFFGGSGGGLAALYFAAQFPGSIALPFNPQTNIAKYQSSAVHDWTEKSFGISRHEYDPLSLLPDSVTTDLCEVYSKKLDVTIGYIQNLNDTVHIDRQMRPFLSSIHSEINLLVLADDWKAGHTPPPKEILTGVLELVAENGPIVESLRSLGFKDAMNYDEIRQPSVISGI